MEMGALVLTLQERGLDLVNIKEKADEWVRNRDDYRSACYLAAPVLAVKLRDALNDLQNATSGEPRVKASTCLHCGKPDNDHVQGCPEQARHRRPAVRRG